MELKRWSTEIFVPNWLSLISHKGHINWEEFLDSIIDISSDWKQSRLALIWITSQ